jgi:hypothetical protein
VPCAFLPSSRTNRVRVTTLVSKAPLSDISMLLLVNLGDWENWPWLCVK